MPLTAVSLDTLEVAGWAELIKRLQILYKNNLSALLVNVIGHLPILGNPQAFMSSIKNSVKNLKDRTSEGIQKGMLETGSAIVSGTGSVIGNTVGGVFGIVSEFTGTIGSGVKNITRKI